MLVVLFSIILKILNVRYMKRQYGEEQKKKSGIERVELLKKNVSYEQYQKVSKESSVLNNPVRTSGDFLDFILESISASEDGIENNILTVNYGEEYGR